MDEGEAKVKMRLSMVGKIYIAEKKSYRIKL